MTEEYIAELIQKYAEGTASEKEVQTLTEWYRAAPIGEVPWQLTNAGEKQDLRDRMLQRLFHEIQPRRSKIFRLSFLKVAAVFLVIVGATFISFLLWKPSSNTYITVANSFGKTQLVPLPDGSTVWLNASATLRYIKNFKTKREVELEGEAFFEVMPDAAHPFSIDAGGVETTVLGTKFNIKAYQEDKHTTVSVVSGSVQVQHKGKALAVLKPAEQLLYNKENQTAQSAAVDTASVAAWRKGKLQFEGQSFSAIASALERWYGVKILFANEGMQHCRYYMSFDSKMPFEKLLTTMAGLTDMQYVFNNNKSTVTLSGKECR